MPTKKRINRKRKGYRKKRTQKYHHLTVRGLGMPDELTTNLSYSENFSSTAVAYYYQFRGNSVFDPNYTGAGNQPNFYDQMTAIYARYKVISSTITVTATNLSATVPIRLVIYPSDIVTLATNSLNAAGNNYASLVNLGIAASSRSVSTTKKSMSTPKINGKPYAAFMGEDVFEALTTTNPTDTWFWNIMFDAYDFISNMSVIFDVTVKYHVRFSDRLTQNIS